MSPLFRDFNPYGGCTIGTGGGGDCPWYKSKTGEQHCESSADFAGIYALSASPEECCKRHFLNVNGATCLANSLADVTAVKAKDASDLVRTKYYYPDLFGRRNCVYDPDYQDWMGGAVSGVSVRSSRDLHSLSSRCLFHYHYLMSRIKRTIFSPLQRCVVVPGTLRETIVQT